MKLKPNPIKRGCKTSPIGPRQMIQGKTRKPKRCTKTQRSGRTGHLRPVSTTAWLWCPPRAVVAARPWYPLPLLGCFGFLLPFIFSRDYSSFCALLPFKRGIYLAWKGRRIHSLDSLFHSQSPLEKIGRKGSKGKRRHGVWNARRKINTPTLA